MKKAEGEVEDGKGATWRRHPKPWKHDTGEDREQTARLELDRDQRLRELQDEDKRYQIVKDLAENLSVSYNTTEVVMARLAQSTE